MSTMPAFAKNSMSSGDASVTTWPVPTPGPGEVLVRVAGCGICGSDLHAVASDPGYEFVRAPVVLGHEFAGTVTEIGAGVTGVQPGQRVVGISIQGCGACSACDRGDSHICAQRQVIGIQHDGALAEYAILAQQHVVPVPDGLDLALAAITEPLSVAVHAVQERSRIRPGDTVVVSGPGTIGLLCGRLAVLAGGNVLMVGTPADAGLRLPAAAEFGMQVAGADAAGTEDAIAQHAAGGGVDVWIEASGAIPALAAALSAVRRGGTVTIVAMFARELTFSPTAAVRNELSLLFSYGSRRDDYVTALGLLADGSVDASPLITKFALRDAAAAFTATAAGDVVKAVVLP